jgi:hypothetical protein
MLKKIALILAVAVGGILGFDLPAQASGGPYYYAGFDQDLSPAQASVVTEVKGSMPAYSIVTTAGTHALAEFAITTDNGATPVAAPTRAGVVEVGYENTNGGGVKVFVSRFVNSVWGGSYVGVGDGFVACTKTSPYSCGTPANLSPGDALTSGASYIWTVTYSSGSWWLAVQPSAGCPAGKTCFLGRYPGTLWSAASPPVAFTRPDYVRAFGEVYNTAPTASVCTNMGDGNYGTATTGAVVGSVTYTGLPTSDVQLTASTVSDPTMYSAASLSGRTFRYGGPGSC